MDASTTTIVDWFVNIGNTTHQFYIAWLYIYIYIYVYITLDRYIWHRKGILKSKLAFVVNASIDFRMLLWYTIRLSVHARTAHLLDSFRLCDEKRHIYIYIYIYIYILPMLDGIHDRGRRAPAPLFPSLPSAMHRCMAGKERGMWIGLWSRLYIYIYIYIYI